MTVKTPDFRLRNAYFPLLSVFVSCLAPWSLTACMLKPTQGLPSTSRICPLIAPSCAAARGASKLASAAITITASAHDLSNRFMLHSPFSRGSAARSAGRSVPHYLSSAPDSKLSAGLRPFAGSEWDPARRLPQRLADAASNCRTRRRQDPRSGSTTKLDAAARPARCPSGRSRFFSA